MATEASHLRFSWSKRDIATPLSSGVALAFAGCEAASATLDLQPPEIFGPPRLLGLRVAIALPLLLEQGSAARPWPAEAPPCPGTGPRCILVRWEKRTSSYTEMLHWVCGLIAWRETGLLR